MHGLDETQIMDSNKNYDSLLFPILNHEGQIEGFFDVIFEFLYRRTDFFKVWKPGDEISMGFPPGGAEKLVKAAFVKYMKKSSSDIEIPQPNYEDVPIDCVAEEVEISGVDCCTNDVQEDDLTVTSEDAKNKDSCNQQVNHNSNDEKVYVSDCESYNGASYDKYSWSQNLKDVDILVKVPQNVISGCQVNVSINSNHLKVEVLNNNSEWQTVVDGDLTNKINVEESLWTLVPHEHIHMCLHKVLEKWWDACLTCEPKIDVRSIDASQPFEDLDEESQAKIQELMYKEHMKRLGKPVVQQSKMTEILREAWNMENSPFRGKPFDPNLINISNDADIPENFESRQD